MSLLERARETHEAIEVYEAAISSQLDDKPKANKERVWQQHRIANLLNQVVARSEELRGLMEDKEGLMKQEVQSMKGRDAFANFYARLQHTREYHQRFQLEPRHHPNVKDEMEPTVQFSGEEVFGKYLDLQALYIKFCNLPFNLKSDSPTQVQDYMTFLETFAKFERIPQEKRTTASYLSYLRELYDYLLGFFQRTQPLVAAEEVVGAQAKARFDQLWAEGKVAGWAKKAGSGSGGEAMNGKGPRPLDLTNFHTPESLEALGLDRLKEALQALGLKCGGTLKDRAHRLFSIKGKKPTEIDPKLLAKPDNKASSNKQSAEEVAKSTAELEYKVRALLRELKDVVDATKRFVEKKQTLTVEELEAELKQEEEGALPEVVEEGEDEDDDEEEPIYNPKNIPLGVDGKPIPYWLYKLHGLGKKFVCEICGNQTYMGRRAFDRHFQEWRHAHGMRCLKIPNTKHFHDITLIEDAINLYEKIKGGLKKEIYDAEAEEQFEDSEGNVLNRRTYEDLARQGLL